MPPWRILLLLWLSDVKFDKPLEIGGSPLLDRIDHHMVLAARLLDPSSCPPL